MVGLGKQFAYLQFFLHSIKNEKELVFKVRHNNYTKDKYYFQKDKKPININNVDTKNSVLSNKPPYGEQGANKYYIAYLNGGLGPLHITITNIKLYTDLMDVLTNDNKLLKYIEIWNKIEAFFNKIAFNRVALNKPVYNNEYIRKKINPYNENFHDFKKLTKDEYCGHSVLLLESISEVKK